VRYLSHWVNWAVMRAMTYEQMTNRIATLLVWTVYPRTFVLILRHLF